MSLRLSLSSLACVLALAAPALAQGLETNLEVTATPETGWDADGFLDPYSETAVWSVNATVEFAANAACASDTKLQFGVTAPEGFTATVDPAEAPVRVVPAGKVSVLTNLTATADVTAEAGIPIAIPLTATLLNCPSPVGTQTGLSVTVNLTFQVLHRPQITVSLGEVRSPSGQFNYTVTNTGNVALLVTSVVNRESADVDATGLLTDVPLDPGEFTSSTLAVEPPTPGIYQLHVEGKFNGPGADQLPFSQFNAQVEIPAAPTDPPPAKKDSPAPALEILLLAVFLVAALSRRHP